MVDLHLHSAFSHDSEELQENYVLKAISLGESVLGFSEHCDYDAVLQGDNLPLPDYGKYFSEVEALKRKYPQIEILTGIELGYSEAAEEYYKNLLNNYPFDYAICSVHGLPEYGDFYHGKAFVGRTAREAYTDYFNAVLKSVKSGLNFQIVGHIGYCERYCKLPDGAIKYDDYAGIIDEILKEIIARGKCLEINTSDGGKGGFLPEKGIVERYLQLGGTKFSFASDAHTAEKYLRGKNIVEDFLRSRGVYEMRYFKNRQEITYKI